MSATLLNPLSILTRFMLTYTCEVVTFHGQCGDGTNMHREAKLIARDHSVCNTWKRQDSTQGSSPRAPPLKHSTTEATLPTGASWRLIRGVVFTCHDIGPQLGSLLQFGLPNIGKGSDNISK